MKVSEQIISVLNALCEKFGIVVDWTTNNVLPYIQDLCGRIINYSIATNIATIVFLIILFLAFLFTFKYMLKKGSEDNWYSDGWLFGAILSGVVFGICTLLCFIMIPMSVMDIIKACTIPELTIIEMVEGLIESKG
jgi:uncharacterized membrane protein